jgi:hypothetical protein
MSNLEKRMEDGRRETMHIMIITRILLIPEKKNGKNKTR